MVFSPAELMPTRSTTTRSEELVAWVTAVLAALDFCSVCSHLDDLNACNPNFATKKSITDVCTGKVQIAMKVQQLIF